MPSEARTPEDTPTPRELQSEREALDRALEELVRRRLELARAEGRAEGELEHATRREPTHAGLAKRWIARGEDPELALCVEDVLARIDRTSQAVRLEAGASAAHPEGPVLVVGALGGMGSWFRSFLARRGVAFDLCDPAFRSLPARADAFEDLDAIESLERYRAIVLCTPLDRTADVLDRVTARLAGAGDEPTQGPTVVEVASIKTGTQAAAERALAAGVPLASLHPMFGPNKPLDEELCFVLACRDDPERERRRIAWLVEHPMTRLVSVPFEHHDRLMGWLLGLAHLSGMAFALALTRSGLEGSELDACASTTYRRQAATARSILGEDPHLYFDIQRRNPFHREVVEALGGALEELVRSVETADLERFRELLTDARRRLD